MTPLPAAAHCPDAACSWSFPVRNTDTDRWDRLNLAALLSMMQEAATFDSLRQELGYEQLDPLHLRWLVSRISLRLDSSFTWRESVVVRTWCRHVTALYFDREFRFEREHGDVVGVANSAWFLADRETHRPRRPDSLGDLAARGYATGVWDPVIDVPRLRFQHAELPDEAAVLWRIPGFSDQDRNGHVNHTRYAAWSSDALWAAYGAGRSEPLPWQRFDINFLSEVGLHERVLLFARSAADADGDGWPVEISGRTAAGTESFRARFS